ncbi:hypothetical protein TNCV_982821 [Trichonephila clavipes]|nr:hypothetical protein TNCV_982821 [Trichonephila clavipes]
MPGFEARCHLTPAKYTQSTCSLNQWDREVLWTESRAQGTGEYFPPLQFHAKIVEVELDGVAIYRPFREFRRAKSYCHLYGAQGQRQTYL